MKLLQTIFVLLLISEHAFAKSKYCIQVKTAYDFDKNDMKPAVERILKNFDYARIDKRGNQLVLRVGNYEHYSQCLDDLHKIQRTYRDAYIRHCDYDPSRVVFTFKNKSYTSQEETSPTQPAIKLQADPQDELEYKIATGKISPTPKRRKEPKNEIQPEEEVFVLEDEKNNNTLEETPRETPYPSNHPQKMQVTPRKRFEYTKNEKYDYELSNQCSQCFAPIELEPNYKDIKAAALKKEALRKKEEEKKNALKLYKVNNQPPQKLKQQEDEDDGFFSFFSSPEKKKPQNFFKNTNEVKKVHTLQKTPLKLTQKKRLPQPKPAAQAQTQSTPEALPETSFDEVDDFFNLEPTTTPKQGLTPSPTQVHLVKKHPQAKVIQKVTPMPQAKTTLPEKAVQTSSDDVDDFFNLEPTTTPKQGLAPSPTQVHLVNNYPKAKVIEKVTPMPQVESDPIDKILTMPVETTQRVEQPKRRVQEALMPREQIDATKMQRKNEYYSKSTQKKQEKILKLPKKEKSFFSFFNSDSPEEVEEKSPNNTEENIYGEPTAKTLNGGLYDMFDIDESQQPSSNMQQKEIQNKEKELETHNDTQEESSYTQPTQELSQEREEHYSFVQPLKEKKEPKENPQLDNTYDTHKEYQYAMTQSHFEQPIKEKKRKRNIEPEDSYEDYQPLSTQDDFEPPVKHEVHTQRRSSLDDYSSFAKPIRSDNPRELKRVKKERDPLDDYEALDDSYTQVSYTPKYKKRKVQTHDSKEKRRKEEDVLMDEYDDLNNDDDSNFHPKKEKEYDPMSEYEE